MRALLTFAFVSVFGLTGCAGGDLSGTYIGNSDAGVYAKLPADWDTISAGEFLAAKTGRSDVTVLPGNHLTAFGAPGITAAGIITADEVPGGVLESRAVDPSNRVASLVDPVISNLSTLINDGSARVLQRTGDDLAGGEHFIDVEIPLPDGPMRMVQHTRLSSDGTRLAVLVVTCSATCFAANEASITPIFTTWKADLT